MENVKVVICGAGIAGVSTAYHLAVRRGIKNIVLVDERAPLSLTSDKSTECYRNWWPGPGDAMVRLMNRSIDLFEELARASENVFQLNRRGYLYVTGDETRIADLKNAGVEAQALGAGPLRVHLGPKSYEPAPAEGFENLPTGADLILDPELIHQHFPFLTEKTVAVLHARRCGYLSAQQYGMYLLECAREAGVRLISARVVGIETSAGHVSGVRLSDGSRLGTEQVVLAGGPLLKSMTRMLDIELPIFCELHQKVMLRDDARAAPRNTPLLIWIDRQSLRWSAQERELLSSDAKRSWLLQELPGGPHGRSEGRADSPWFLLQWTLHEDPVEPAFPVPLDPEYPEIALRGVATMLPALARYTERLPQVSMDGGYYTKTRENRPLIGPLPVDGAYVMGAFSGFGIMASAAAGDLMASHVNADPLPTYAPAFRLDRYDDSEYQKLLAGWKNSGQL